MSQATPARAQTRILIVDDSAFMRTALARMIASEADFEVAGTACSGSEALAKIKSLNPDVVTLDVEMPGIDGLETLRSIMNQSPRPVIMVSAVTEKDADKTFQALAAGAFDYIPKQLASNSLDILHIRPDLVAKIRAAAGARYPRTNSQPFKKPPVSTSVDYADAGASIPAVVAVGISTGGPKALQEILPCFPRDFSVPILIVQHMPPGFTGPFAQRLNNLCALAVCEATHHDYLQPGVIYIAPAGLHMTVERQVDSRTLICLNNQPQDCLHIPSVDILMKSVAEGFGNQALGVIMTGMGSDGAEGMRAIHRRGGFTIGQDEATCTVYGMPRACAEMRVLSRVAPLAQIPGLILQATRYRKRA
jgi:two-component system, chemotaxis family, protein-glutamate methylesterase/glutaminase